MIRILDNQVEEYNSLNPEYPIRYTAAWATTEETDTYEIRELLRLSQKKMEADGISFNTEEMKPPHHVPADSEFVKTLLAAYEKYSGRKGECIAIGGGTYVHNLKNGVAFGAALPETENHMHGPDEFAVVDELTMSAKILRR